MPEVNVEDLLPLPKVSDDRRQLPCRVGEALGGGAEAEVEAVVGGVHERAEAAQPLRTQRMTRCVRTVAVGVRGWAAGQGLASPCVSAQEHKLCVIGLWLVG